MDLDHALSDVLGSVLLGMRSRPHRKRPRGAEASAVDPTPKVEAMTDRQKIFKTFPAETKVLDDGTLEAVISTEQVDRDGDIIRVSGWELDNYRANPVVLFAHNYDDPPVGKAVDIGPKGKKLVARIQWSDEPEGQRMRRLYEGGFMKAFSVGFMPTKEPKRIEESADNPWGGYEYKGQELLEFSAVPVPSNPGARALALTKGLEWPEPSSRPWREASSLSVSERIQAAAEAGDLEAVATFAEAVTATVASQQEVIEGLRKDLAAAMPSWRTLPMTLETTTATVGQNVTYSVGTTTTLDPTSNVSSEAPAEEPEAHAEASVQAEEPSEVRARRKEEIRTELRRLLREERRELG